MMVGGRLAWTLRLLEVLRREWQRIRCDVKRWRSGRPGLERLVGGWWGAVFTAIVVFGSEWIDPTRLEGLLRLAVTPLAVLWGFQEYARGQKGSNDPDGEGPEIAAPWTEVVKRLAQLAGINAVVGILILEAFATEHPIKDYLTPVVLLFVCIAVTNAMALTYRPEPPRFYKGETKPTVADGRMLTVVAVDIFVSAILTMLPFYGVLGLRALGVTPRWDDLAWVFMGANQIWGRMVVVFWLYQWLTLATWGRGLGGLVSGLRLADYSGESPGRIRILVRATFDTVVVALLATASYLYLAYDHASYVVPPFMIAVWMLSRHDGRSLIDVLTGSRYEPHTATF